MRYWKELTEECLTAWRYVSREGNNWNKDFPEKAATTLRVWTLANSTDSNLVFRTVSGTGSTYLASNVWLQICIAVAL